jgi:hypothetical protein
MYVTTGKSYGMPAPFISSTSVYPYFTIGIYATDDGGNSWGLEFLIKSGQNLVNI